MKKVYLFFAFILFSAALVSAQTMTVHVSGKVTADSTGVPVANHEIIIRSDSSSGFVFYATRHTGANGMWDCAIPNVPTTFPVTIFIRTYDCNNNMLQESILSTSSPAVVNFVICVPSTNCEAAFTFNHDSTNLFLFHFNSTSYVPAGAIITSYSWDFGDGTTSNTQNPSHIYASYGTFHVCLTITTSTGCTSMKCREVQAGVQPNCETWFTYTKSLLTVNFEGHTSSPHPTSWAWNFGDPVSGVNNISTLQFTTHTFSSPGTYIVRLQTVDSTGCADTSFQEIHLSGTVDVHGAVHAGNHFVDHGMIQLIRVDPGNVMTVVDTKEIGDSAGMYAFGGVSQGNYYLKAELLPSSAFYGQYVPTYYHEALHWTGADLIVPGTTQNPYNFGLMHVNGPVAGNGTISGTITLGSKVNTGGTPAPNVEVLLLDEQNAPLAYVKTNVSGYFEFPDIAFGNYVIWPEVAGLTTQPAQITLSTATPAAIVPFSMTGSNVVYGIQDKLPGFFSRVGEIFPNPVTNGSAGINMTVTRELMLELVLYNITGQVIRSNEAMVHKGANLVPLNLENLPGGPYFLQIRSSEGGTVTKKVSVTE